MNYSLDNCLHRLIESQTNQNQDAEALRFDGQTLSYKELNERSNQCAHYLREVGVGPNKIVAVLMERSLEMSIALLAILKAGGAYLPIDPDYPTDRIDMLLEDAGVSIVLAQKKTETRIGQFFGTVFCLDDEWNYLKEFPLTNPESISKPDDLAYVIYTSGSTGKPKGCMISHKAICNRLLWMREEYQISNRDRILQKTPYTFDVSVWEFFLPLLSGACLVVAKPNGHQDTAYLVEFIKEEAISVCHFVPSMLHFFLQQRGVETCTSLQKVFTSGEALTYDLGLKFDEKLSGKLHNLYGPTEAAVDVTYWEWHQRSDKKVPIGKPIKNIEILILDNNLKPVPAGEKGMLYIGGVGLANGYLHRPELTSERFIQSPFSEDPGVRLYNSGDNARYLEDGNIEYLGRTDSQVKVRGFRIELGEIEAALVQHPDIERAVVLVQDAATSDPKLVAYVVANAPLETKEIRQFIRGSLPEHMVPNKAVFVDTIPVTAHGKTDLKKLRQSAEIRIDSELIAPENTTVEITESPVILEELLQTIRSIIGSEDLGCNDDLFDAGATSFTIIRMIDRIQEQYDIHIPLNVFMDFPTVSAIGEYLTKNTQAATSVSAAGFPSFEELNTIFEELLRVKNIRETDDLFDLGATSFTIMQLVERLQNQYAITIPIEVFLDDSTAGVITRKIRQLLADKSTTAASQRSVAFGSCIVPQTEVDKNVKLEIPSFSEHFFTRAKSNSTSSDAALTLSQFGQFLSLLRMEQINEKGRYLYASAGGLNPVQTYVYVKENGVEDLNEGIYYYHPVSNQLCLIKDRIDSNLKTVFFDYDQPGFEKARFALFFISRQEAIQPIYSTLSSSLVLLEAGYMGQLLESRQQAFNLELRPANGVDFQKIKHLFDLEDDHRFLHCLLGGLTSEIQTSSIQNAGNRNRSEYISETGKKLHGHCSNYLGNHTFSAFLEEKSTVFNLPSQELVNKSHSQHLNIREIKPEMPVIKLEKAVVSPYEFEFRSAKRTYTDSPVPFAQFSRFMALLGEHPTGEDTQFLYTSITGNYPLKHYVYIKENGVENMEEGVYCYDPVQHQLSHINSQLSTEIKNCYTPFNRTHANAAKFCLFVVAPREELENTYGDDSTYMALLEAGYIGQLLLDKQAEFEIGICPIGEMRFEKIRADFKLSSTDELLHSFVCGNHILDLPENHTFLESDRNKSAKRRFQEPEKHQKRVDIAIIGMSGRFPDAPNLEIFRQNLQKGKSSFKPVSESRSEKYGKSSSFQAAFLNEIDSFDSALFNIPPVEAKSVDPQERLLLEVVWECLENAGYTSDGLNASAKKTGVFIGVMWDDYQHYASTETTKDLPVLATSHHSSIANRISYTFNFTGPSIAVNTSCSSALSALHAACNAIKNGECDVAVVGSVNLLSHPYHYETLEQLELLSKTGNCHPFGKEGDGWMPGEGVGAILLKSLTCAEEQHDFIHGIVKGTATGHSGKSMRFGAPDSRKQQESMRQAIENAGVSLDSISYVEAAAPGASLADASETTAVKELFNHSNSTTYIGSLKANIGHLEAASGMSQLMKVLLQMREQDLYPTLNTGVVNPLIRLNDTGLELVQTYQKWDVSSENQAVPKRALINAFGATGSSGHAVVESYISAKRQYNGKPCLLVLSAATSGQLAESAKRLYGYLTVSTESVSLTDVSYTLQSGRREMKERLAIIASSVAEVCELLFYYLAGETASGRLFTGTESEETAHSVISWETDLETIAEQWVNGSSFDRNRSESILAYRVPLPTYPFAKESHWVHDLKGVPDKAARLIPNTSTIDSMSSHSQTTNNHLLKAVQDYLKQIVFEKSGIPVSRITSNGSFDDFGISSQMIRQLNLRLESDFGPLSQTLFFEFQTIQRLANYFVNEHADTIRKLFPHTANGISIEEPAEKRNESSKIQEKATPPEKDERIAIIGLSGRYPKSPTIAEFWENLKQGVDCISEIPLERWNHSDYFSEDRSSTGKTYAKWGGFIDGHDQFDPLFFNISPHDAKGMDPQERVFLETAWHTIEDAGYNRKSYKKAFGDHVGVFVGVMYNEYLLHSTSKNGNGSALASSIGSIANRVSYSLGFSGPSMGIDTMCSSSLTALHLAVNSIKNGDCKAAIVGGVNLALHPNKYILHAQLNMSSSDGRCRSFGEGGDGFVPGEGVGAILLKPLSQALKDGDQIYATIRGTAINHDGKTHGYTVPNPNAQAEMIAQALRSANVDPKHISYVEAHGTGTSLGDPIEISGLTKAFGSVLDNGQFCSIGSVKSNIGHLEAAAGIAGLTKILLQMKHKTLVPSLHSDHLNANIDFEKTPFYVQQKLEKWKNPNLEIDGKTHEIPLMACISGFGAGGANAHAILEEYKDEVHTPAITNQEVIVPLSAKNEERLVLIANQLLQFIRNQSDGTVAQQTVQEEVSENALHSILNGHSPHSNGHSTTTLLDEITTKNTVNGFPNRASKLCMADLAYTLQAGREPMETRMAVVVKSLEELTDKLERFVNNDRDPAVFHFGKVPKNTDGLLKYMDDEDLIRMTEAWVFKKKYPELMDLWTKGLEIDWQRFHHGLHPKRISLPTYPFSRERYWVSETNSSIAATESVVEKQEKATQLFLKPVWQEEAISTVQKTIAYSQHHVFFCGTPITNTDVSLQNREITYHQFESEEERLENRFTDYATQLFEAVKTILHASTKGKVLLQVLVQDNGNDAHLVGLAALLKTINRENPTIYGQLIVSDELLLITQLEVEGFQSQSTKIRYRNGKRFVHRLQELTSAINERSLPWKNNGIYLISGGTGGLGLVFAREIAQNTSNATVILTGRSALSKEREASICELTNLGISVQYKTVDIQDELQVNTLIESIMLEYGSLNGILHCAGITKDQFSFTKNTAEFREVLGPKVAGTYNLDTATKAIDLDFFILFSSTIALTGNVGQIDYACANAFMDEFALERITKRKGRTLSINWPFWQHGGMTTNEAGEEAMYNQWGMLPMNTTSGIAAFYTAMASNEAQVIILNGNRSKIQQAFLAEPIKYVAITEKKTKSVAAPKTALKEQLKALFSEISTIPISAIDAEERWENYGVDSIMITRLNRKLEAVLGEISKTLFYEHQTLNALTEYIAGNFPEQCNVWIGSTQEIVVTETQQLETAIPVKENHKSPSPDASKQSSGVYREPIAIIGLNGTFPQAKDLDEYWKNLESGKDCIVEIPKDRWSLDGFFTPSKKEAVVNGTSYSKWGGFIDEFDTFDPLFFNISPHDAFNIDPQERLFLQSCWKLIEDAGYTKDRLAKQHHSNVGVFAGVTQTGFELYGPELRKRGEQVFPRTSFSSVANRVSFALNLNGPSMPVDTMCSSSLTAIHEACRHLEMGDCEMAIAGAVNLYVHPVAYAGLCSQQMLSVDGKCKSFGVEGNGFVPGEGVGVVLLKKLSDAIRDKDQIHGIIRGTGVNHGGRANGYTVPSPKAQGDLIRETLDRAGINARTVSYLEAHGTGTELGDPIEITGLTQAFEKDTSDTGFCAIGSAKSNHGHLEAAAGMAGLTKVLLQMKHGKLVPSLHAKELNPNIPFSKTPFIVQQQLADWKRPVITLNGEEKEFPRIAGISSFGAGGANAHMIVEEFRGNEHQQKAATNEMPVIIVLSAKKEERLKAYAKNLLQFVKQQETALDIEALAYTLQVGREAMDVRLGMVVSSREDLLKRLHAFVSETPKTELFHYHQVAASKEVMAALASDEDMVAIIDSWIENTKYDKILEYWIKGGPFDWNKLYASSKPATISAPTYPFANERYWLTIPEIKPQETISNISPKKTTGTPIQPLLKTLQLSEDWIQATMETQDLDWKKLLEAKKEHAVLVISDELNRTEEIQRIYQSISAITGQQALSDEIQHVPFTSNKEALRSYLSETKKPLAIFLFLPATDKNTAEQELESVYNNIKSLLSTAYPETIQFYCCYETPETERIAFREGLSGLLKSAMLESEGNTFRSISFDSEFGKTNSLATAVIREWLCDITLGSNPRSIPMIRYEGNERKELQLSVCQQQQANTSRVEFKTNGTYLMIGSMGDVGSFVCQELGNRYQAKLVILSRRPENEVTEQLQKIKAAGASVSYYSVDILDPNAVQVAIESLTAQGITLNGVVHMARQVHDGPIIGKDYAEFSTDMAAKVAGTLHIDTATAHLPLDFFLIYSSMAAFGIKGSPDYAYSTAFQNSFVRMRNKQVKAGMRTGKSVAICWGQWDQDGAVPPEQLSSRIAVMQELGIGCLNQQSAIEAMDTCLGCETDVVGYLAVYDEAKALQTIGLVTEPTKETLVLQAIETLEKQQLTKPKFIAFLKTLDSADYTETIRQKVMQVIATLDAIEKVSGTPDSEVVPEIAVSTAEPTTNQILERTLLCVEKVLKISKDQLDIFKPLQDYGLDSIRAMQLSITLENEFNIPVQSSWLIQHPSLDSLANQLTNKMTV